MLYRSACMHTRMGGRFLDEIEARYLTSSRQYCERCAAQEVFNEQDNASRCLHRTEGGCVVKQVKNNPSIFCTVPFVALAFVAWGTLGTASIQAQSYPSRPIRFIVPFPPGGSTDTYSRIIGTKLSEGVGQPLVIDNRAGAAGALGAELAAKAVPDGYTVVLGQDGNLVVGQAVRAKKNYDTLKDFAPISLVVRTPQVIVVNDSSPLTSIKDLIAAAKAKPGALTFATAGIAGSSHIQGTFFNMAAGIDTIHVPYKGGGPGMLDLRAGRVSYMSRPWFRH